MENTKITNHQMFSLVANGSLGASVIVIASVIAQISKQDAWISSLVASIFGMGVMWMYWFLGSKYPNMTFIEIIQKIFGKYIGVIISIIIVFFYLYISCHVPWYIGNFLATEAMTETPQYITKSLFVLAVVIALLYGIEAIARSSEVLLYFASILIFLAMILVVPNAKIQNLQPVMEGGIAPILKAALFLSCLVTFPLITLMMIYPINVKNIKETKKCFFKGYLFSSFINFITIFMTVLVLGSNMTAKLQYPTYILLKQINVGDILTRLEFLIAAVWIATEFIINILLFYAGVIGLSRLLGLKDYRKIVIPAGFLMLIVSGIIFPNIPYQIDWVNTVWIPYSTTIALILPIVMILVFEIRKLIHKI